MSKTHVMTGATGLIGRHIYRALRDRGDNVIVLTRNPERANNRFPDAHRVLLWAPGVAGEWSSAIDEADCVIHLAGEPIAEERWTDDYKRRIHDSRILGTRDIVSAMVAAQRKPRVLLSVSAVGYYGNTGDLEIDETSDAGNDFLATVCRDWEAEALHAAEHGVRVVTPRLGVVLAQDGGALEKLLTPFKMFAGGPVGNGDQWFPWVHIDDVAGMFLFAIENENVSGALNVVSPEVLRNRDFAVALGETLNRPARFSVPAFVVKLALGEFGETLLGGQRVHPQRVLEHGYTFRYADIHDALRSLVSV